MDWPRLYIVVEGQTEREFVKLVLAPHLATVSVDVKPCVVHTNRGLNKRGGLNNFKQLRSDLERMTKADAAPQSRFTTMIDLYALPAGFPGWETAKQEPRRVQRVAMLEEALQAEIGDPRFFPHIQVHEFETLLFCDLTRLEGRIEGADRGLLALQKEVAGMAPEDINERPTHAPSKRMIKHVPAYKTQKVRVGAAAAAAIGLPKLREKCPHFDAWVTRLEQPVSADTG
jgi:hypothetical protein